MTKEEAGKLGYEVIAASPIEVGLTKNEKGLMTWWARDFDGKLPSLDHPKVQEAIQSNENFEKGIWD